MKAYVILMILLVVGGTVLDMMHKQSAKYFFENSKKSKANAKRKVGGIRKSGLAVKTVASEVLTSSEFCNARRRKSHLCTMYGFILFVVTSAILIFSYTANGDSNILLNILWHVGAALLCFGGYWFWFSIRVDVASEGVKWNQFNGRGDLFILGLLAMGTFGLLWSLSQIIAMADGSRENLPDDYDLSDPEVQAKFPDIAEYMGANPPNMGLGIKREAPNHF